MTMIACQSLFKILNNLQKVNMCVLKRAKERRNLLITQMEHKKLGPSWFDSIFNGRCCTLCHVVFIGSSDSKHLEINPSDMNHVYLICEICWWLKSDTTLCVINGFKQFRRQDNWICDSHCTRMQRNPNKITIYFKLDSSLLFLI
jgi:hypothetical protein